MNEFTTSWTETIESIILTLFLLGFVFFLYTLVTSDNRVHVECYQDGEKIYEEILDTAAKIDKSGDHIRLPDGRVLDNASCFTQWNSNR